MPAILKELDDITLPMWGAFLTGLAAAIFVVAFCWGSHDSVLQLLALTGAIAGWVAGVLAAPFSEHEKQQFGGLAKVISGFVTGYLLSKIDPLINALVKPEGGQAAIMQYQTAEQILVTLSSFGIALLFVFNARLYWSSTEKALRDWINAQPGPKPSRTEAIKQLVEKSS